jgi:prophage regulatory protein
MNVKPTSVANQTDDRLLTVSSVTFRIGLSASQIYRLEKAGQFPARIGFGQARSGWVLSEVRAWMQKMLDARAANTASTTIALDDRFICKKGLKIIVPYSSHYVLQLERGGSFPRRIAVGSRIFWLEREVREWLNSKRASKTTGDVNGSVLTHLPSRWRG